MFGYEFVKNLRQKCNTFMSFGRNVELSKALENNCDKELDGQNGFVFSVNKTNKLKQEYYLPEEILALVLSYVDVDDLFWKCRLVCQSWKEIIETLVLRIKTERECASRLKRGIDKESSGNKILSWKLYYSILKNDIFGRNLLKNNCGQDKFQHWKILSNGGDKLIVERTPIGSDPLPNHDDFNGLKSCFVTSYYSSTKAQMINLSAEGLVPEIMDKYQPAITVSEWFTSRFDCGCIYELNVMLLDKKKVQIRECLERREVQQGEGRDWRLIEHTFRDYGPGIRYITFCHGGRDTMFWAGHYGCKMAGGTVKAFYSP